jgi:hypothetical protein
MCQSLGMVMRVRCNVFAECDWRWRAVGCWWNSCAPMVWR